MAAGSIIVDLLMRTGSFQSDTERAAKSLKAFQKRAEEVGKTVGLAIAGGVTLAVGAFDQLVKSAADFKDFEETIGASAEDIASLSIAAATAGVSMDSVTGATIKLTKGLTGVDDESKAAGAALAALGLNIEEFKRLDPVAQYEAVGKALNSYADGAQKTAVAVALFGKSGAEQLKVFKALEEQGGRQITLTQKQIEMADAYADAQARQIAQLKVYAQAVAVDFLPALNDVIAAGQEFLASLLGVQRAGKSLSSDTTVRDFADGVADAFAFVVDQVDLVVRLFQIAGKATAGYFGVIIAGLKGNFSEAVGIAVEAAEDIERVFNRATFGDKLRAQRAARTAAEANPASYSNEGRLPTKLGLQFDGAVKADKAAKDKTTEADRYLDRLREQVEKTQELSEIEKVLADIQAGKFKGAKQGQIAEAVRLADQLDGSKKLQEDATRQIEDAERLEEVSRRLRDETSRIFEDTRTPAEAYAARLERLNYLLETGSLKSEVYARAVEQLQDQFDENVRRQKDLAASLNQTLEGSFADSFEGFITGSMTAKEAFASFARSVIADLARINSQDLAKSLFKSGSDGTAGIGGYLSKLFSGNSNTGTGFGTGSNFGNQDYGAFLATGTNYVPHDGFRATLHKGEAVVPAKYNPAAGARAGDTVEIVPPPGMPLRAQVQRQQSDGRMVRRVVLSTIMQDTEDGGPAIKALSNKLGVPRQLPRRGR